MGRGELNVGGGREGCFFKVFLISCFFFFNKEAALVASVLTCQWLSIDKTSSACFNCFMKTK